MKSRISGLIALAVVLVFVASSATLVLYAGKPTKTITGVVRAYDVRSGKVKQVFIKDPEQGAFLVLRGTEKNKELCGHVRATVKATGYIREATREKEFEFIIDILEYEIVAPPPKREKKPKTE